MITITLSIGSLIIGFLAGFAIMCFALWLAERVTNKDNQFHVGFSHGWDAGRDFEKEWGEKYTKKG